MLPVEIGNYLQSKLLSCLITFRGTVQMLGYTLGLKDI